MSGPSIFDVAAKGYRVYPILDAAGKTFPAPKEHATTTPSPSWGLYERFGIFTGEGSDVLSVDLDRHEGGADGVASWVEWYGSLPEVHKPSNGGSGVHGLYRVTPEQRARIGKVHVVGILPGVDAPWNVRCSNTMDYSALPPVSQLPAAPERLIELIAAKAQRPAPASSTSSGAAVAAAMRPVIPQGEQWTTLRDYAAHLRGTGVAYEVARDAFAAAMSRCEGIDDEGHAWTALTSAYERLDDGSERREENARVNAIAARLTTPPEQRDGYVPPASEESEESLYGDVAGLLDNGIPDPPAPEILPCGDGVGLFYAGQLNIVYGDPESGKTWLCLAAVAETLAGGGRAAVIDVDHNGLPSTVSRLLLLGAPKEALRDLATFRYAAPEDGAALRAVALDLAAWRAGVVVLDSVGEVLPMFGANSNDADDFTRVHQTIIKPMTTAGAAVLGVDHLAKNADSRAMGATGTAAKKRAIGGTYLRVSVVDQFAPGKGGSARVTLSKDRHGGLRARRAAEREPLVATFRLFGEERVKAYAVEYNAGHEGEGKPLENTRTRILAATKVKHVSPPTIKDLEAAAGVTRQTVAYHLERLVDDGLVEVVEHGSVLRYKAVEMAS